MGADLFIRSVSDKAEAELPQFMAAVAKRDAASREGRELALEQAEVERLHDLMHPEDGYFRDSYNGTSLLSAIGMSWWKGVRTDKDGNIPLAEIARLRDAVDKTELPAIDDAWCKLRHLRVDDENTADAWRSYFTEKKSRFLRFLDHALALGEPIYASL